jgi:hypothetical protein
MKKPLSVSEVLKSIDPLNFNLDATVKELKTVVARVPRKNDTDSGQNIDAVLRAVLLKVAMLKYENGILQNKLSDVLEYIDDHSKSEIDNLLSKIIDYPSAANAYDTYNGDWFSSKPYSLERKAEIAASLINLCKPYNLVSDFWVNILNYQSAATSEAEFTMSKDNS